MSEDRELKLIKTERRQGVVIRQYEEAKPEMEIPASIKLGWLFYSLGQWLLGIGFGIAACTKWPALLSSPFSFWVPLSVGYVIIHTAGRKRNGRKVQK
jgi:hypothetical protein